MRDTLRATFQRVMRRENRRTVIRPGRLEHIEAFESKVLGNERRVTIYLPAGYDERPEQRYPVLYMQDGQNLFEAHRAFIPGQHWRLAEAANEAIGERTAEPLIIVGIDNTGAARADEYTPVRDVARKVGGRAEDYATFLLEELKPEIDTRFRTRVEGEQTGIGGSSLGGLLTLFVALRHPAAFSRAMVMSPSVWWMNRAILDEVDRFSGKRPRLWLDIGGREGKEALSDARLLRDRLLAKGWSERDLRYFEDRRADHSERAWALRVKQAVEFLFAPV